jgi:hypothetical protein
LKPFASSKPLPQREKHRERQLAIGGKTISRDQGSRIAAHNGLAGSCVRSTLLIWARTIIFSRMIVWPHMYQNSRPADERTVWVVSTPPCVQRTDPVAHYGVFPRSRWQYSLFNKEFETISKRVVANMGQQWVAHVSSWIDLCLTSAYHILRCVGQMAFAAIFTRPPHSHPSLLKTEGQDRRSSGLFSSIQRGIDQSVIDRDYDRLPGSSSHIINEGYACLVRTVPSDETIFDLKAACS